MLQRIAQRVVRGHALEGTKVIDGNEATRARITAAGGFTQPKKSLFGSNVDVDEEAWLMKAAGQSLQQCVREL